MRVCSQWLNSIKEDLNYNTLREELWILDFIDTVENHEVFGTSRNTLRQDWKRIGTSSTEI